MPDKNVENKDDQRSKDYFVQEISSIGMSLRPSGSASSGESMSISYQLEND